MARKQPFEVQILPHITVTDIESVWDQLDYEHYKLNEPSRDLPLSIFDVPPAFGKRVVVMCIEIESENTDTVNLVLTGGTFPFRDRLNEFGLQGGYVKSEDDGEKGKYYRVWNGVDLSVPEQREKVLEMIGSGVFNNIAIRVKVDGEVPEDSHIESFIDKLKSDCYSLYFEDKKNTSS